RVQPSKSRADDDDLRPALFLRDQHAPLTRHNLYADAGNSSGRKWRSVPFCPIAGHRCYTFPSPRFRRPAGKTGLGDFAALFGILFAIALAVVAFVLPIVALVISRRSSQRVEEMTTRLETLQRELAHLWRQTQTADRAAEPSTLVSAPARAVAETASASDIRPAKTAPPSPAPLGRAS